MRSRHLPSCHSKRLSAESPRHGRYPSHSASAQRSNHAPSAPQSLLGVLSPPLTPEDTYHSSKTKNEHVDSSHYGYSPQPTNDEARRGIMPSSISASSPSMRPLFTFPNISNTKFTFRISPRAELPSPFSPPSPPSVRSWKRGRLVSDVDGEHSCLHKKKRRLRLFLITSRLSPQFSHPASNIVDRGSSKIAVWAKQRPLGRNILRKAAILNGIRRQSMHALETASGLGRVLIEQEKEQEQFQLARLTLFYGSHDSATRPVGSDGGIDRCEAERWESGEQVESNELLPGSLAGSQHVGDHRSPNDAYAYSHTYPKSPRPSHLPLPPSPLGLSNYDALDLEDGIPDPYAHLDDGYDADEQPEDSDNAELFQQPLVLHKTDAGAFGAACQAKPLGRLSPSSTAISVNNYRQTPLPGPSPSNRI